MTVQAARHLHWGAIVGLMNRCRSRLICIHLAILREAEWARVVVWTHDYLAVAVAIVSLIVGVLLLSHQVFGLLTDVLHTSSKFVWSARLPAAMTLALHYLTADSTRIVLVLLHLIHRLVYEHRGSDMLSHCGRSSTASDALHLDVLHLCLVNSRSFSLKQLLLVVVPINCHPLLYFMRFRRWTFWLCEFLSNAVCFIDTSCAVVLLDLNILMGQLTFDLRSSWSATFL